MNKLVAINPFKPGYYNVDGRHEVYLAKDVDSKLAEVEGARQHLREGLEKLAKKLVDHEAEAKRIVEGLCDRLLKIDNIVYGPGSADDKVQMIAEWSGGFCKMPAEASDLPVIHESTTRDDLNARFRGRKRVRAPEDDFNAPSEDL